MLGANTMKMLEEISNRGTYSEDDRPESNRRCLWCGRRSWRGFHHHCWLEFKGKMLQ